MPDTFESIMAQMTGAMSLSAPAPTSAENVKNTGGYVMGVDLGNYAENPRHVEQVRRWVNNMPQFGSGAEVDAYIKQKQGNSPLVGYGDFIYNHAKQAGFDPRVFLATLAQESSFGTAGAAAKDYNPANIGGDPGNPNRRRPGSWEEGLAYGLNNLAKRAGSQYRIPLAGGQVTPATAAGKDESFEALMAQMQASISGAGAGAGAGSGAEETPGTGEFKVGGGIGDDRGKGRLHKGVDFYAPEGAGLPAPGNMRFVAGGQGGTNLDSKDWWSWWEDVDTGMQYRTAHHGPIEYKPGDVVQRGQEWAKVGGVVSKPHLHMSVFDPKTGKTVDYAQQGGLERGQKGTLNQLLGFLSPGEASAATLAPVGYQSKKQEEVPGGSDFESLMKQMQSSLGQEIASTEPAAAGEAPTAEALLKEMATGAAGQLQAASAGAYVQPKTWDEKLVANAPLPRFFKEAYLGGELQRDPGYAAKLLAWLTPTSQKDRTLSALSSAETGDLKSSAEWLFRGSQSATAQLAYINGAIANLLGKFESSLRGGLNKLAGRDWEAPRESHLSNLGGTLYKYADDLMKISALPDTVNRSVWGLIDEGMARGAMMLPIYHGATVAGGPFVGFTALGALEGAHKGIMPAIEGAVSNLLLGGILHGTGPLSLGSRIGLMGAIGAADTWLRGGTPQDIVASSAVWSAMAVPGNSAGERLIEAVREGFKDFKKEYFKSSPDKRRFLDDALTANDTAATLAESIDFVEAPKRYEEAKELLLEHLRSAGTVGGKADKYVEDIATGKLPVAGIADEQGSKLAYMVRATHIANEQAKQAEENLRKYETAKADTPYRGVQKVLDPEGRVVREQTVAGEVVYPKFEPGMKRGETSGIGGLKELDKRISEKYGPQFADAGLTADQVMELSKVIDDFNTINARGIGIDKIVEQLRKRKWYKNKSESELRKMAAEQWQPAITAEDFLKISERFRNLLGQFDFSKGSGIEIIAKNLMKEPLEVRTATEIDADAAARMVWDTPADRDAQIQNIIDNPKAKEWLADLIRAGAEPSKRAEGSAEVFEDVRLAQERLDQTIKNLRQSPQGKDWLIEQLTREDGVVQDEILDKLADIGPSIPPDLSLMKEADRKLACIKWLQDKAEKLSGHKPPVDEVVDTINKDSDQPFKAGDRVRVGSRTGTLMEVSGGRAKVHFDEAKDSRSYLNIPYDFLRGENDIDAAYSRLGKLEDDLYAAARIKGERKPTEDDVVEFTVDLESLLDITGVNMYSENIPNISVKEMLQNAFDATKSWIFGPGKRKKDVGKIDITVDDENRTITFTDNGIGMNKDIMKKAFFKLAGTHKEGLDPSQRSGGLGMAKAAFMFGVDEIKVETVRDGVKTTTTVIPKELLVNDHMKKMGQPPKFAEPKYDTEKVSKGEHGTSVTVKIPKYITNKNTGEQREIYMPWGHMNYDILDKPLIGNVEVRYKHISDSFDRDNAEFKVLPLGKNFDLAKMPKLTSASFSWGTADIYLGTDFNKYPKHTVLSSGIYQFKDSFELKPFEKIPYDIVVDIKPNVDAHDADYPFKNNRESFKERIKPDIKSMGSYLAKVARGIEASNLKDTMKDVKSLPRVDVVLGEADQASIDRLKNIKIGKKPNTLAESAEPPTPNERPKKIFIDAEGVKDALGKLLVDPNRDKNIKDSTFKADKEAPKVSDFMVDLNHDPRDPIYHNNTTADYIEIGKQHGDPERFFSELGSVVNEMKEAMADSGLYEYDGFKDLFFGGIGIDKDYAGVHTKVPYKAVLLNPLGFVSRPKNASGIRSAYYETIVHELAHIGNMNHGEGHNQEMSKVRNYLADNDFEDMFRDSLLNIILRHEKTLNAMRQEYDKSSTRNVSKSLKATQEESQESRGDTGRDANLGGDPSDALRAREGQVRSDDVSRDSQPDEQRELDRGVGEESRAGAESVAFSDIDKAETQLGLGVPLSLDWFKDVFSALKNAKPASPRQKKSVAGVVSKLTDEVKRMFAPETRSEQAMETGKSWVQHMQEAKAQFLRTRNLQRAYINMFGQLGYGQAWKLRSRMERGEWVPPEFEAYAKGVDEMFASTYKQIKDLGQKMGYIEHYAPHMYTDPSAAKTALMDLFGKKPMEGKKSFLKKRLIPDMDTAMSYGLHPAYDNPVLQDLAGYMNQLKFIAANKFMQDLERRGLFNPIDKKTGQTKSPVPKDWVKTDARVMKAGWAPPTVVDLINNHLIPEAGGELWNTWRSMTAAWNAWHVTLSAFHAMATTVHEMAMGFGQNIPGALSGIIRGDMAATKKALKRLGPMQVIDSFRRGIEGHDAFYNPGKHGPQIDNLVSLATKGGLLPEHITGFQGSFAEAAGELSSAFKAGQYGRSFQELINVMGLPIMGYFVPRMKYGSTLVRLERGMNRLRRNYDEKYGKAWTPEIEAKFDEDLLNLAYNERQHSDNIFGEVDYDNLHWNRGLAKGLKFMVAYPGWNIGTFRWMTGLVRSGYRAGESMMKGKFPEMDYQAAKAWQFGLGLMVANALANTIMHIGINGSAPEDWKDVLIGARTGRIMSNGNPERVGVASYMKDLMGFGKHPIKHMKGKIMFGQMVSEMYTNADFTGTEIVRSKGNILEKAGDVLEYAGKQVLPYGFSGMTGVARSPLISAGGFFGLRGVGREYSNTTAQQYIDDTLAAKLPALKTQPETVRSRLKAELRDLGWNGQRGEMEIRMAEAKQQGILSRDDIRKLRREALQDPRIVQFHKLTDLEDMLIAYGKGNPEEQMMWRKLVTKKIANAKPKTKRKLREAINEFYGR